MADFAKVTAMAQVKGDKETEATGHAHIAKIEQQIWNLRQR